MGTDPDEERDHSWAIALARPLSEADLLAAEALSAEWGEYGGYDPETGQRMAQTILHLVHEIRRLREETRLCDEHHWVAAYAQEKERNNTLSAQIARLERTLESVRAALARRP